MIEGVTMWARLPMPIRIGPTSSPRAFILRMFRTPEAAFYDHDVRPSNNAAVTPNAQAASVATAPHSDAAHNTTATSQPPASDTKDAGNNNFSELYSHDVIDAVTHHTPKWSIKTSVIILAVTTLAIVFMSELLVHVVEPVAMSLGIHEFFLGVIVIPIVGNVAEHIVGVQAAVKNQMELSLNISLGSSMQIALFVAPLLVFLSLFIGPQTAGAGLFGRPLLTLFFSLFEVVVLGLSVIIAAFISVDGESNWLEGALLLGVYVIAAFGFFYL